LIYKIYLSVYINSRKKNMSSLWNQYGCLRNEIEVKIEARLGGGLISDGSFKRGVDLKGMAKRLSELEEGYSCILEEDTRLSYWYNQSESLNLDENGTFSLIGFLSAKRIFEVLEELLYFIEMQ